VASPVPALLALPRRWLAQVSLESVLPVPWLVQVSLESVLPVPWLVQGWPELASQGQWLAQVWLESVLPVLQELWLARSSEQAWQSLQPPSSPYPCPVRAQLVRTLAGALERWSVPQLQTPERQAL